jgi:hypothetical protein
MYSAGFVRLKRGEEGLASFLKQKVASSHAFFLSNESAEHAADIHSNVLIEIS